MHNSGTYGIGHKGRLRFELVAENSFVRGQVLSALDIVDAFGKNHQVMPPDPGEKASGELVHNPNKVFD
jgi:hypothetical protein